MPISNKDVLFWKSCQVIGATEADLRQDLLNRKGIKIKFGCDPTSDVLHIGHCVMIERLKYLQELGHDVTILIGSFTAMIGDPSGLSIIRTKLSREKVHQNFQNYKELFCKILDERKTRFVFNHEWFETFNFEEVLDLLSKATISQLLQRQDFRNRLDSGLRMSEVVYPLLQAYDSVVLESEIEIGGHDQLLNLLQGRTMQIEHGMKPQIVIQCALMPGLDGQLKMSKTLNNQILINDPKMFHKFMSLSDVTMWKYIEGLMVDVDELIDLYQVSKPLLGKSLRDLKSALGHFITLRYMGKEEADQQRENFQKSFQSLELKKEDLPHFQFKGTEYNVDQSCKVNLVHLLLELKFVKTKTEAKRLLQQGAISINRNKVKDTIMILKRDTEGFLLESGKVNKVWIVIN